MAEETAAANNSNQANFQGQGKSGKKGCLFGCLAIIVIAVVVVAGVLAFGYFNRNKILPAALDKLNLEVTAVMKHMGEKVESGLPPEFMDHAYQIKSADGTIKVTKSDASVDETYNTFTEYFKAEGWTVDEDLESLPQATSKQVKAVVDAMNKDRKMAVLEKGNDRMFLILTGDEEETLAAVIAPESAQ